MNTLNTELLGTLESINKKRNKLNSEIEDEMAVRNEYLKDYEKIKQELMKVDKKLEKDYKHINELDNIIGNTQVAADKVRKYKIFKINENLKTLHSILKKDEGILSNKKAHIAKIS